MTSIDELLEQARSKLHRVTAEQLEAEMAAGAVVVDIRPVEQRERDGELPGAVIIDRNVLEWRLARSSEARSMDLAADQAVIVMCNEGFQSSLAAATLQELGLRGATDLEGGYQAYLAAHRDA